jgi:4'-phosphopantetheinyl transferase
MIAGFPADVRVVVLSADDPDAEAREAWLSDSERSLLASFSHPSRKRSFVQGRAAARMAIAAMTGRPRADIQITVEASGAVSPTEPGLYLSIAHSGSLAAAAACPRPIGVDIERVRDVSDGLLRRIAADDERQRLDESGLPRPALVCWTLKEAVLKGIGTGLRTAPRRLRLEMGADSAVVQTPDHGTWEASLRTTPNYLLAVAWKISDS